GAGGVPVRGLPGSARRASLLQRLQPPRQQGQPTALIARPQRGGSALAVSPAGAAASHGEGTPGPRQRRTARWKNRLLGTCSTLLSPSAPVSISCRVV